MTVFVIRNTKVALENYRNPDLDVGNTAVYGKKLVKTRQMYM